MTTGEQNIAEAVERARQREKAGRVAKQHGWFNYSIIFQCDIGGKSYEFHKEVALPTQLRGGDIVHFDALEEVLVQKVVWYLDMPGHAFVELQKQRCGGTEKDWQDLFDEMDYSIP